MDVCTSKLNGSTHSSGARLKKRSSFAPIILTSQSMRPIEREKCHQNQQANQRIFSSGSISQSSLRKMRTKDNKFKLLTIIEEKNQIKQRGLNSEELRRDSKRTPFIGELRAREEKRIKSHDSGQLGNMSAMMSKIRGKERKSIECNEFDDLLDVKPVQKTYRMTEQAKKYTNHKNGRRMFNIRRMEEWNKYHKPSTIQSTSLPIQAQNNSILQEQSTIGIQRNIIQFKNQVEQNNMIQVEISVLKQKKSSRNEKQDSKTMVFRQIEADIQYRRSMLERKDHFVFMLTQFNRNNQITNKKKFQFYKDFLFKINYTNSIYMKTKDDSDKIFKYYVGSGNNSALLKRTLRLRFWWGLTDKIQDANFVWTQLKRNDFHSKQNKYTLKQNNSEVNHNEFDAPQKYDGDDTKNQTKGQTGDKAPAKNIKNHQNSKIMRGIDLKLWNQHRCKNKKSQEQISGITYQKRINLLRKKPIRLLTESIQTKVHNHFQCNYYLGNKKALFYNMKTYYDLLGHNPFAHIPVTFHILGTNDSEYSKFLEYYNKVQEDIRTHKLRNIWIVKPGQVTNRGKGIILCSTLDQIVLKLRSKERNSDGSLRTFIVQKYIQKPLLYEGRKFDIRHYMAITCVNGLFKGYWYQEGYIRTSSYKYNTRNYCNLSTHLTNDAIQKNTPDYGKHEKANKLSYAQFQKYLQKIKCKINFEEEVLPTMQRLATEAIQATYRLLDDERREFNFELFGLDYMLDESMHVYLIEVNTNPCLQISCPLLSKIITPMIDNLLKIGLDPIFPPPSEWPNQKSYQLGDNALEDNKFTLVFDEAERGAQLSELYNNTTLENRIGLVQEQNQQYEEDSMEEDD